LYSASLFLRLSWLAAPAWLAALARLVAVSRQVRQLAVY
jgi:hypothetical protein